MRTLLRNKHVNVIVLYQKMEMLNFQSSVLLEMNLFTFVQQQRESFLISPLPHKRLHFILLNVNYMMLKPVKNKTIKFMYCTKEYT